MPLNLNYSSKENKHDWGAEKEGIFWALLMPGAQGNVAATVSSLVFTYNWASHSDLSWAGEFSLYKHPSFSDSLSLFLECVKAMVSDQVWTQNLDQSGGFCSY